jgi:hypothetical protein
MLLWSQDILNHLRWAIDAANGEGQLCQRYVLSTLLHVIGVHTWDNGKIFDVLKSHNIPVQKLKNINVLKTLTFDNHTHCCHETESRHTPLSPSSPTFMVLLQLYTSDNFLNELAKLSPKLTTSNLESFHAIVSDKYRSKQVYFDLESFTYRTKLAILHYNFNVLDELQGIRYVRFFRRQKAKHRGGDYVWKAVKNRPFLYWKLSIIDALTAHHRANYVDVPIAANTLNDPRPMNIPQPHTFNHWLMDEDENNGEEYDDYFDSFANDV